MPKITVLIFELLDCIKVYIAQVKKTGCCVSTCLHLWRIATIIQNKLYCLVRILHTNIIASVSKSLNLDFKDTTWYPHAPLVHAFPLTFNASLHQGSPLLSAETAPRHSRLPTPVLSGGLADISGQAGSNMNLWAPSPTPLPRLVFWSYFQQMAIPT